MPIDIPLQRTLLQLNPLLETQCKAVDFARSRSQLLSDLGYSPSSSKEVIPSLLNDNSTYIPSTTVVGAIRDSTVPVSKWSNPIVIIWSRCRETIDNERKRRSHREKEMQKRYTEFRIENPTKIPNSEL
jgi:CRISPR/Cas system CSM-associated protein Csm5 (group 7 of RAMP superfamily)